MRTNLSAGRVVRYATAFAKAEPEGSGSIEFEMPEDVTAISDDELAATLARAREAFEAVYGDDGTDLDADQLPTLSQLTEAYEALRTERDARAERAEQARSQAAELAERMRDEDSGEVAEVEEEVAEASTEEAPEEQREVEPVLAAAPAKVRVPRRPIPQVAASRSPIRASVAVPGFQPDDEMDMEGVARAMLSLGAPKGLGSRGRNFSQRQPVAVIKRDYAPEATVGDPAASESAIKWARNQHRLPGGSLVAAGGWCAPSETIYDLCQLESRDGLISLPEINATRGGIRNTLGPDFADIFADTGFCFTESQDEAGDYDPDSPGIQGKPCTQVPCPPFVDTRLEVCGVCVTAGNLMNRAYPELVTRYVEGAVTGHFHRVSGNQIARIVANSTAVTVTDGDSDPGTAAPLLAAVELQVEDLRYRRRMSRTETLEAVFPYWARGAIRADLSRRLGVDLLSVTDGMINDWFALRGVSVQWVYNFSDGGFGVDATPPTAWPLTVDFLLYPAGAWVSARTDVINLELLYDSTLNAQNNFTAIFTEEGWAVIEVCPGSRIVTVPLCVSGATQGGVDLVCSDS